MNCLLSFFPFFCFFIPSSSKGIDVVLLLPPDSPDTSPWHDMAVGHGWRLGQVRTVTAEEDAVMKELGVIVKRV